MLLSRKAAEAEQEIARMRLSAMRTEEEKVLEKKSKRKATKFLYVSLFHRLL